MKDCRLRMFIPEYLDNFVSQRAGDFGLDTAVKTEYHRAANLLPAEIFFHRVSVIKKPATKLFMLCRGFGSANQLIGFLSLFFLPSV